MISFSTPAYQELFARHGITSEETLHRFCTEGDPLYEGSISTVWRKSLGDIGIFAKRYRYASPSWRYFFMNRGRWEIRSFSRLRHIGIPCPEVMSFSEKRGWRGFYRCIIITREIPNSCNLYELFRLNRAAESLRIRIMERLGHFVGLMHDRDFFHRDLKLRNIIWEDTGEEDVQLFFLDCPRGRRGRFFRRYARYDLWTLYRYCSRVCTETEWHAFLDAYAVHQNLSVEKILQGIRGEEKKRRKEDAR